MNQNDESTNNVEQDILNAVSNWEKYKTGEAQLPSHNRTPLLGLNVNLNPKPRETNYGSINKEQTEQRQPSIYQNAPTNRNIPLNRAQSIQRQASIQRNGSVRRQPSIQKLAGTHQTDFTNTQELQKFKEKKRFIFHKGFFKRNSNKKKPVVTNIPSGQTPNVKAITNRFRTRTELEAVLNYADVTSLNVNAMFPQARDNLTRMYRPVRKYYHRPQIKATADALPVSMYQISPSVSRTSSIKRPIPSAKTHDRNILRPNDQPPVVHMPSFNTSEFQANTPQRIVKRSKTSLGGYRNVRMRNMTPERRAIHSLWQKYMMYVIYQRINLRMSLMTTALTSDDSDPENELDEEDTEDIIENYFSNTTMQRPPMITDNPTMSTLSSYKVTPTSGLSIEDPIIIPEEGEIDHILLNHSSTMLSSRLHLIESPLEHTSTHSMTTSRSTSNNRPTSFNAFMRPNMTSTQ